MNTCYLLICNNVSGTNPFPSLNFGVGGDVRRSSRIRVPSSRLRFNIGERLALEDAVDLTGNSEVTGTPDEEDLPDPAAGHGRTGQVAGELGDPQNHAGDGGGPEVIAGVAVSVGRGRGRGGGRMRGARQSITERGVLVKVVNVYHTLPIFIRTKGQ